MTDKKIKIKTRRDNKGLRPLKADLTLPKIFYTTKELVSILKTTRGEIMRIIQSYGIKTQRRSEHYKAFYIIHRKQVVEIAEILRLRKEGIYTRKGMLHKLHQLRIARKHYQFEDRYGNVYTYGAVAGDCGRRLAEIKRMKAAGDESFEPDPAQTDLTGYIPVKDLIARRAKAVRRE